MLSQGHPFPPLYHCESNVAHNETCFHQAAAACWSVWAKVAVDYLDKAWWMILQWLEVPQHEGVWESWSFLCCFSVARRLLFFTIIKNILHKQMNSTFENEMRTPVTSVETLLKAVLFYMVSSSHTGSQIYLTAKKVECWRNVGARNMKKMFLERCQFLCT